MFDGPYVVLNTVVLENVLVELTLSSLGSGRRDEKLAASDGESASCSKYCGTTKIMINALTVTKQD